MFGTITSASLPLRTPQVKSLSKPEAAHYSHNEFTLTVELGPPGPSGCMDPIILITGQGMVLKIGTF